MTSSSNSPYAIATTDPNRPLRLFRTAVYPRYAVYLVVSLIFVVIFWRVLALIHIHLAVRRGRTSSGSLEDKEVKDVEKQARNGNSRPALRRVPGALLSGARILAFRITLPASLGHFPLVEVVVSLGYLLALLVFEFVKARNVTTGALDATYWANRAATLAVSQLTFVVALASKNNIVSALTGISYEKLNVLHRAASRVVLLLIWVHMWGRWRLGLIGKHAVSMLWMQAGILSTIALTLAVILGSRQLRNHAYELFLAGHVILVFIFLLAGYYHVKYTEDFLNYCWPPFLVWGLDRFLRLARALHIRYLSVRVPFNRAPNHVGNTALEVLSPDILRVSLRIADSRLIGWKAGQSAYLTVPAVSRIPLEAHPFTISTIDERVPALSSPTGEKELEMTFIIRVRLGFTRRLHAHAAQGGRNCTVSAFVDGPYGAPPDLRAFGKVVLIAGGSGVSFTLPLLLDLARRAHRTPRDTLCKRVLFVWLVRSQDHASWIEHELAMLAGTVPGAAGLNIDVRAFVTGASAGVESGTLAHAVPTLNEKSFSFSGTATPFGVKTDEAKLESPGSCSGARSDKDSNTNLTHTRIAENTLVTLSTGRPSIARVLEDELCAEASAGEVGVCVSGPNSLIADVRAALRSPRLAGPRAVLRGDAPGVFLHVEHFGM